MMIGVTAGGKKGVPVGRQRKTIRTTTELQSGNDEIASHESQSSHWS